jgi:hypothetical protein
MEVQLGELRIRKIYEMQFGLPMSMVFPQIQAADLAALREWYWSEELSLTPESAEVRMSVHSYVLQSGGKNILVDCCNGNDKPRDIPPFANKLQTDYLKNFRATGLTPEDIDVVLCTHLHGDHVGWNTRIENGRWVPTFPNARYLFTRADYEYFGRHTDHPIHGPGYLDSVLPVMEHGLADLVDTEHVVEPPSRRISWGTKLLDYDNDGNLDLFLACGHVYGELEGMEQKTGSTYRERCMLFHGAGSPTSMFEDVSARSGPAFEESRVWRGAAFADFDDDGDLDVFLTSLNGPCGLFRNDGGNRNNFLVLRLVGKGGLRDPSGARVTVWLADGKPHMEELHHGVSFCGDNDPRFFFGLGKEESAARVEVRWPGGETQSFENVAGRTAYVLEQGKKKLKKDVR